MLDRPAGRDARPLLGLPDHLAVARAGLPAVFPAPCAEPIEPALDTNRIERRDFSRMAAATLPKNSVSPARRLTPMTITVFRLAFACRRMASSAATSTLTSVRLSTL